MEINILLGITFQIDKLLIFSGRIAQKLKRNIIQLFRYSKIKNKKNDFFRMIIN